MKAINILERNQPGLGLGLGSSSNHSLSSAHSHAEDDECPVCKNKMIVAKIKLESVYFCPEHRITFPMREHL